MSSRHTQEIAPATSIKRRCWSTIPSMWPKTVSLFIHCSQHKMCDNKYSTPQGLLPAATQGPAHALARSMFCTACAQADATNGRVKYKVPHFLCPLYLSYCHLCPSH